MFKNKERWTQGFDNRFCFRFQSKMMGKRKPRWALRSDILSLWINWVSVSPLLTSAGILLSWAFIFYWPVSYFYWTYSFSGLLNARDFWNPNAGIVTSSNQFHQRRPEADSRLCISAVDRSPRLISVPSKLPPLLWASFRKDSVSYLVSNLLRRSTSCII